jgi:hypothetical protein
VRRGPSLPLIAFLPEIEYLDGTSPV